jgi:phosphohistidine phosphatase
MKILSLLRHAKSGWEDKFPRDFDRPLNARGRMAARAMGREMRALGLGFDRVLASPAARVAATLDNIAETYGRPLDADYDRRIYLASPEVLLEVVRNIDDGCQRLLLVGHNPGMEMLALALSRPGALRDEVEVKYPTGALAEISLPADHWRAVSEGSGTLRRFIRPRDLDPALAPEAQSD